MHSKDFSPDKHWTLFLDRDGVINERLPGDYVKDPGEFRFLPGATAAIAQLSKIFGRVFIVTNQQGIGKGLMTEDDLTAVHDAMMKEIRQAGGRIDRIYYSPHLDSENNPMRKPGTGMALQAKNEFPEIEFSRAVMVGDSLHDMEFGKKLGKRCVFISPDMHGNRQLVDDSFTSLEEFAESI